jgi:hypothetical protein
MSKIPALKKVLPTSPDAIQRFSSEAEAAVARMSHLNRLALYVGNEIENLSLDFGSEQAITITKPCGVITVSNFGLGPGDDGLIDILYTDPVVSGDCSVFVQLTPANSTTALAIRAGNLSFENTTVPVVVTNLDAAVDLEDFSFFYTIIPQLS